MKNIYVTICSLLFSVYTMGQQGVPIQFQLVQNTKQTRFITDKKDFKVVEIAADLFAQDVHNVSGKKVERQLNIGNEPGNVVIAGTIGKNKWIDKLIADNKINAEKIRGTWERFAFYIVNDPIKNVRTALVVVGSDRRGTAYGILELSRLIGVSPWEWWADVHPQKRSEILLNIIETTSKAPSVKYRGVFLNDEDWGLQPWAAKNYEPETGDIGPKTYARIFELLLRLRANTIWPAMHSSTKPFYSYPKNKVVADQYAMVIGTSHAEPMLCNINTEWNKEKMGEYRYDTNAAPIKELFTKRAKETAPYEGIYTTGMRGEHDSPMIVGEDDTDKQVELLEKIISDQRNILKKELQKDPTQVPQAFVPYKEVLKYYQNGLHLPEDITLVWTDDNYGYIRQLSTPQEQKRSGGAGVYYHTSYWGRPHDYLWLNSTNPVLMRKEMSKAYEFGSKNIWILNCGDIKPHEYNMELFMDMAWNMNNFEENGAVQKHLNKWATREFGSQLANDVTSLLLKNNHLAYKRRPEFMAWSQTEPVTKSKRTELSHFQYGDEVTQRIEAYQNLEGKVEKLYQKVKPFRKDAFYQLVYYPVIGASKMNQKWLYRYKNEFVSHQNRSSANDYAQMANNAYHRIVKETEYYNKELSNGKWNHIMSMSPRYLPVYTNPAHRKVNPGAKPGIGVALEGYEMEANNITVNSFADVLPVFNQYVKNQYYIDVFLKGKKNQEWKAVPKDDWILVSKAKGELSNEFGKKETRIWVNIDWDKVPQGVNAKEAPLGHDYQMIPPSYKVNSAIDFMAQDTTITIGVSVYNPKFEALKEFKGFVEDKGYVSINAENYTRKNSGARGEWEIIDNLGYSGAVIGGKLSNNNDDVPMDFDPTNAPSLEYDFYTFNLGEAKVKVQAVPTHPIHKGKGVRCALAIDDSDPVIIDFETFGRSETWKQNVLKNAAIATDAQIVDKAGKHTLKIWMIDEGLLLDQILIDLGGKKPSYAFPPETIKK